MNNKELYKKAFSTLHTDHTLDWEVLNMKKNATGLRFKRSFAIVTAILILIVAMTCISYAATDGQVLNAIKIWINGEPVGQGSYTVNEDGSFSVDINPGDRITIENEDFEFGPINGLLTIGETNMEGENVASTEIIISEIIDEDESADETETDEDIAK